MLNLALRPTLAPIFDAASVLICRFRCSTRRYRSDPVLATAAAPRVKKTPWDRMLPDRIRRSAALLQAFLTFSTTSLRRRRRPAGYQTRITRRRINKGLFRVRLSDLEGQHYRVLDDVLTTAVEKADASCRAHPFLLPVSEMPLPETSPHQPRWSASCAMFDIRLGDRGAATGTFRVRWVRA